MLSEIWGGDHDRDEKLCKQTSEIKIKLEAIPYQKIAEIMLLISHPQQEYSQPCSLSPRNAASYPSYAV